MKNQVKLFDNYFQFTHVRLPVDYCVRCEKRWKIHH